MLAGFELVFLPGMEMSSVITVKCHLTDPREGEREREREREREVKLKPNFSLVNDWM